MNTQEYVEYFTFLDPAKVAAIKNNLFDYLVYCKYRSKDYQKASPDAMASFWIQKWKKQEWMQEMTNDIRFVAHVYSFIETYKNEVDVIIKNNSSRYARFLKN